MKGSRMTEQFSIIRGDERYDCQRIVSGARVLRQTIVVFGVGRKEDSATYGAHGHPMSSMASVAAVIAREIVDEMER